MRVLVLAFCSVCASTAWAGQFVGETPTYDRDTGFTQVLSYVASGNGVGKVEYVCTAYPSALTSEAKWQIQKLSYDSSHRVTNVQWAGGTDAYTNICDNETSLTYN